MRGPQTIEELVGRLAERAKHLPQEQAQVVASCLEYALRGSQDDRLYEHVDSIFAYFNQPSTPLLKIDTLNGNINAIEHPTNDYDNPNQSSQRRLQCVHE